MVELFAKQKKLTKNLHNSGNYYFFFTKLRNSGNNDDTQKK